MDSEEALRTVTNRILQLGAGPTARKTIEYIQVQGLPVVDIIRLAHGPDASIHNLIREANTAHMIHREPLFTSPSISPTTNPSILADPSSHLTPFSPFSPSPYPGPAPAFQRIHLMWGPQRAVEQQPRPDPATVKSGPSSFPNDDHCLGPEFYNLGIRGCRNSSDLDYPVKPSHFSNGGFGTKGYSNSHIHKDMYPNSYPQMSGDSCPIDRSSGRRKYPSSHKVFWTFPASSTFTGEDAYNYSSAFGPVEEVTMKHNFGFVTFKSEDTVKLILSKMNPHRVAGDSVDIKKYIEYPKRVERKNHPIAVDSELKTIGESSGLSWRREMEENGHDAMELETARLSQLQLGFKSVPAQSCLGSSMDDLNIKLPRDKLKFPSEECLNALTDLNSTSTNDENPNFTANNCGDQKSAQGYNLPDDLY